MVEEAGLDWERGIPGDGSRPMGASGVGIREVTGRRRRVLESIDVDVNRIVGDTWPWMRGRGGV